MPHMIRRFWILNYSGEIKYGLPRRTNIAVPVYIRCWTINRGRVKLCKRDICQAGTGLSQSSRHFKSMVSRKQRKIDDYKRQKAFKEPRKSILIVCEGKKTEQNLPLNARIKCMHAHSLAYSYLLIHSLTLSKNSFLSLST